MNPPSLPWLSEISGALHLAEPGLTAGRQAGWQADEIHVIFEIFKIDQTKIIDFPFSLLKNGIITAVPMHSVGIFG